ncbi:hypothetical protein [Streptomyces sp. NPDC055243]|uniref:hypothetical protein n=1 Tax=Streptomyces sp. NPDC055243 TaxID=3365720 RepID=UPI0037D708ED
MPTTGSRAAPPSSALLSPGLPGPFGVWPTDDHQDDEDQEHELVVDRARETST